MSGVATQAESGRPGPTLFYVHPLLAGPLSAWPELLRVVASLGFSHVVLPPPFQTADLRLIDDPDRPHPALGFAGGAAGLLTALDEMCRAARLAWMLDVRLDAVAGDGRIARDRGDLFHAPAGWESVDPAAPDTRATLRTDADPDALASFWAGLMERWHVAGAAGFRLGGLAATPPALVALLATSLNRALNGAMLVGTVDDVATDQLGAWRGAGLDRVELAIDRWDDAAEALLDRAVALSSIAPLLPVVERPFGPRFAGHFVHEAAWTDAARRVVQVAAGLGDGWLMPQGFATGETLRMDGRRGAAPGNAPMAAPWLADVIREANDRRPALGAPEKVPSAAPGVEAVLRRAGADAILLLVNRTPAPATLALGGIVRGFVAETGMAVTLAAGAARTVMLKPAPMIRHGRLPRAETAAIQAASGRVAIEAVAPAVDDGRFAAKRVVGETVVVSCDVICDGHDQLAALLEYRTLADTEWHPVRMSAAGNDRWQASFDLVAVGRWQFRVSAWRDAFATYRDELTKKSRAGLDVSLEVREGQTLIAAASARARGLAKVIDQLEAAAATAERVALLLSADVADAMRAADDRPFLTQSQIFPIDADRVQARFASWYEIFPRSMSGDGVRHGTFRDVIAQLPRIRDMGFDVLYFPPIHPIGRVNRKGRNNSLTPGPDDPGSPYAIGSTEGGHDALHPELGSFEDFEALRATAAAMGLELALDFAIQCAPDHPWLTQHKGWFDWRPDGSLRYAENPPKKYEDIVNVDFYAPDAVPDLWVALSDVVFFWLERGVRIFRVDNPHTKPLPFWEWLFFEVRCTYPDAIFLAEAFTRPKVMNRLGKIGFSQSYTYFTWRNTKAELQEYLTQLTTTEPRDFFRPNFFVNTPDINPPFLQNSGRAGFLIRAALAATLSGSWGVYCGFELCEATPVPGREEYLDSEKYQLRAWDWESPGNIVAEITRLNAVRRQHPALWSHLGVSFLPTDDDQVIFFEKATADRADVMLVAICLDPFNTHSAAIELPLWRWGLSDQATLACRDVLHDTSFTLSGKWQRVALSPDAPYTIWHASPQGPYSA